MLMYCWKEIETDKLKEKEVSGSPCIASYIDVMLKE